MISLGAMKSMRFLRKGAIALSFAAVLMLALAVTLAACGPRPTTGEPASTPASTAEPTAAPTTPGATAAPTAGATAAAPTEAPQDDTPREREKGVLRRLFSDPPTLDPHLTTDATSATIIIEIFGGLVTINPNLEVVPDLAERWDESDDGLVYTFHIRQDAVFHNGKPITAHDFKWSLERAADAITESLVVDQYLGDIVGLQEKLRGEARDVQGVRVIDDHTLEITISEPKSYFIYKLTYPTAFVLDQENVETGRRWVREPNGSGPFMLSEYVPRGEADFNQEPQLPPGPGLSGAGGVDPQRRHFHAHV